LCILLDFIYVYCNTWVAVPRFEPALPRRKKHPELAYKTHEFLTMSEAGGSDDSLDSAVTFDRARVSILLAFYVSSNFRANSSKRKVNHFEPVLTQVTKRLRISRM
jgi:hypothetical protein